MEHITANDEAVKDRLMKDLDGFLDRDRDRELSGMSLILSSNGVSGKPRVVHLMFSGSVSNVMARLGFTGTCIDSHSINQASLAVREASPKY